MTSFFSFFFLQSGFFFYLLSAHEGGKIQVDSEQILTNETQSGGTVNYETCEPSSLGGVPAKRASGYMSTTRKTSQRSITYFERARILESIPFESTKPFFKVVMQPTYVGCKAKCLVRFSVHNLIFTPNCK